MSPRVTALARYPMKSGRGEPVQHAVVEPWGLRGDRRWMVVDESGAAITAREVHRLLLVRPELTPDGLLLSAPDASPLHVPVPQGPAVPVDVWGSALHAVQADVEACAWMSKIVETDARLVYLADPTQRPTNPTRTEPTDRVSFADGYPLLLASEESLTALNDWIAEGPRADEGPLPMQRFRPSVVVAGAPAFAEDTWRRIRIGAATFRMVKGCDRCVMTTLDPDTGQGGKEPIATLARYRRWDGKTWFAVNLVPDRVPGIQGVDADGYEISINVGDEVEVLSADASAAGPLR
ncbi:MAG TPA: MOSC N-terminal beta barrel domain-containing protein [Jatrophihabitantaceae bacterium]